MDVDKQHKEKQHLQVLGRKGRKRRGKERRNMSLIEINPSNTSGNIRSSSATDYPRVVSSAVNCNYSPYPPQPIWRPRYFAGSCSDPRLYSSFPPGNEISLSYTRDVTFGNNENRQENLPFQQEEPMSTNSWKPTGDLMKNEVQYTHDMKTMCDYVQAKNVPADDKHDIFLDALQRLSKEYIQGLLKERDLLKSSGNINRLKENTDFIMGRLDSMLNVFRLANGAIGISKMQQDALLSSETVLEAVKNQLIDCNVEFPNASSPCEAPSPRFNQEHQQDLEEARKEVHMLLQQLAGTQSELEEARKQVKDQMDEVVNQKDLLLGIRANLLAKIQCSEILKKSFTERLTVEEIVSDIKWLIKNKIPPKDEGESMKMPDTANSSKVLNNTEYEIHLVTMIASFLRTISFPVDLDFIYAYVERLDNALSRQYIESLLKKYPTFFREESVAAGQSEKNYSYIEMKPIITI